MHEQCFYCEEELASIYSAMFILQNEHIEKELCEECYKEWLQGIKG